METQMHVAPRPAMSRSGESDLDRYLDAIDDATTIFRSAVDVYLANGPDGACWQQAKRISEQLRRLDDMQQEIEMAVPAQTLVGGLFAELMDPLTGVGRLLKDMKRQITGFAIESGFSGPGRRVPAHLVPDVQELADEVCAAVDALVDDCRASMPWAEPAKPGHAERSVSWYEGQADRLSSQLIRKIFADEVLDVESQLPLAQLIEEIDRVADYAESIDREVRSGRMDATSGVGGRDSH